MFAWVCAGLRPNKQSFASDRPSCMGGTLLSSLGVWGGWVMHPCQGAGEFGCLGEEHHAPSGHGCEGRTIVGWFKEETGQRMELLQFWRIYRSAKFLVSRLCVPHMGFFTFNHGKWKLYFDVFCYVDPWHARTSGPDMRNFSELFGTEMGRRAQPITERQVRVKWRVQFNNRNTMRWEMFRFRCRFKRWYTHCVESPDWFLLLYIYNGT